MRPAAEDEYTRSVCFLNGSVPRGLPELLDKTREKSEVGQPRVTLLRVPVGLRPQVCDVKGQGNTQDNSGGGGRQALRDSASS